MFRPGIEELVASVPDFLRHRRLGLLCNQASTDRNLVHSRDLIAGVLPGQLVALFSPQHGFFCEKQDNMVESDHGVDPVTGLPVYSLYGERRKPDPAWLEDIDVLLVDLVDVGTRVYTFVWTVVLCLQAAAETGTLVCILDRPNPIGGHLVEGNLLQPELSSFVGLYPLPMRHGLTLGELALLCNREMAIHAGLEIVRTRGWQRHRYADQLGFPWVFPSPNMPTLATALVYPGQVIWEGTNLSEGRGTTLPFELFGAPFLDSREVLERMHPAGLAGCTLRPLVFEPTSGKWQGQACQGFQLHVTDREGFRPYRTALALLQAIQRLYPDSFAYKPPPYEYEYEQLPLDLILGDRSLRLALESGEDILALESSWQGELSRFMALRSSVLLYD